MRFDSTEYLRAFQEHRTFPKIHDDIFNMIINYVSGTSFLDLCCSTGLLVERLLDSGYDAIGVEQSKVAIEQSSEHGLRCHIEPMLVQPSTMQALSSLIEKNGITVLVARRCLPEIFNNDLSWVETFTSTLHKAGITEVVLQGRQFKQSSTNVLPSVSQEIRAMEKAGHYYADRLCRECAYMRRRG